MKHPLSVLGAVLVVAVSSVACDKIKPPLPEVEKPPAASGQASQPDGERKAFTEAAEKELDALKANIAEFKTKAEASGTEVKAKLGEEVQKLEADLGAAQQRLAALKDATAESWSQLKDAWSSALQKLKSGVENYRKNAA